MFHLIFISYIYIFWLLPSHYFCRRSCTTGIRCSLPALLFIQAAYRLYKTFCNSSNAPWTVTTSFISLNILHVRTFPPISVSLCHNAKKPFSGFSAENGFSFSATPAEYSFSIFCRKLLLCYFLFRPRPGYNHNLS